MIHDHVHVLSLKTCNQVCLTLILLYFMKAVALLSGSCASIAGKGNRLVFVLNTNIKQGKGALTTFAHTSHSSGCYIVKCQVPISLLGIR